MTRHVDGTLGVVIGGGGTGGHLYPGIAVAREILRRWPDARVSFAGTSRGIEARVVPAAGFALDLIRSAGLKGKSTASRVRGAALLPASAIDAWRVISRRRPDIVIGVGGYSSGPIVLTAALRRVPTMVLEQNAVPGVTNRVLARWVDAAAVTYEETLAYFGGRGFVSGNPVRPEFLEGSGVQRSGFSVQRSGPRVLVVGGSQGAHAINVAMVAAAPDVVRRHPGLELVHQTGERDLAGIREGYGRAGITARTESFFDAMAGEMTAADVVVCRAGATTLAELAALGKAAVLVPFAGATDDHQRRNASVLARAGAADVIDERELTGSRLADAIDRLIGDAAGRRAMAEAMRRTARPDAAARIVDRVEQLVSARGDRTARRGR